MKIGSKYHETKSKLKELIKESKIKVYKIPKNAQTRPYACYFCLGHIAEDVYMLEEDNSKFFIHENCYLFPGESIQFHNNKAN
ncbi:MAG: hypothetical protein OEL89_01715 [Candidatus Peregrinibacteria bacterium]|nr:hypothetical protein [Candidatus Peregrinibacteria bacterium]